jgi:hypothetical protein
VALVQVRISRRARVLDRTSAPRGGSLAPFTWGSLSSDRSRRLRPQPGEIAGVPPKDGWCVLLLIDRIEAMRPALDERISTRIATKLKERRKATRTNELSALWKKYEAHVVLDDLRPQALGRLSAAPDTVVATWTGGDLKMEDAFTDGELKMFAAFVPPRGEKVEDTLHSAINMALIRLEANERKIAEVAAVAELVDARGEVDGERAVFEARAQRRKDRGRRSARIVRSAEGEPHARGEAARRAHRRCDRGGGEGDHEQPRKAGADFAELLEQSLDKPSVKNGGDLGWIEKGKVLEKYDPLFTLPVNGIAKPIQSDRSWHIVRVTDIAPEHPLSFEEAGEKIKATLLEKKKHDARERWIEKLREAGEIEILEGGVKEFVKANPYEDPNK